jgi:prophage maintenance system killer protein
VTQAPHGRAGAAHRPDRRRRALLHSLARNHPLVDGNKRLAWLATYVFLAKNDVALDPDDVAEIAVALAGFVR